MIGVALSSAVRIIPHNVTERALRDFYFLKDSQDVGVGPARRRRAGKSLDQVKKKRKKGFIFCFVKKEDKDFQCEEILVKEKQS